jgi:di/tricarboxylate transporter
MTIPGPHAIAVLLIAVVAFYLYTRPRIRMELVAMLLLVALVVVFYLFPLDKGSIRISDVDVLSGFGHPVLIAILCLMILGRGMLMTGALEPVVRMLTRLWKWSPAAGLLLTLLFGVTASAFINDTPVLVMMLPMLLGIAERTGTSPAKTLMPVNFAILGGGMVTSLGTSTNLLVISIAADLGVRQIGIFDFTMISAGALLIAIPYLWLIAPRLLKPRKAAPSAARRHYEARIKVVNGNALAGTAMSQAARKLGRSLPVAQVVRAGRVLTEWEELVLQPGDEILITDTPAGLREIAGAFAVELFDKEGLGAFVVAASVGDDQGVAELVIGPKSLLCGNTLGDARFAEQFGVVVIALHRSDTDLLRSSAAMAEVPLQAGDLLLVQGPESRLEAIRGQWDLMMLDSRQVLPRTPLAPWALGIMAAVVALASFKVLPIHVSAMLGVVAMLCKGCVKFEGIGRALSLEVVLLVASSIALGLSLVGSGAADWLASGAVAGVEGWPPALQIASIMTLSALLTNFVSNSAAAAIGTPIAVTMAAQLGLPAEPFVLAILFGANLSYATPMAYQTNLLVMSAAGYSFRDFVRVGLPLVVLMLASLSWLLVRHYSL